MSSGNRRRLPRRTRFTAIPTKLLRAFFSFDSNCVLGELPFLPPPSDVVPAAAAAASYLSGPKVGEPTNGGGEDAISIAKGDDAGNSVHPSRIELHEQTYFKNPLFGFASSLLRGVGALFYEHGWPSYCNIYCSMKNVDVRVVQICVRKLAANSGDCAIFECAALPL